MSLVQNPFNGYLYLGEGNSFYRSTDGGANWTAITNNMNLTGDHFTSLFAFPGGRMIYRDFGGVGYSSDFGATWIKSTTGMDGGMITNLLARSNGHLLATAHQAGIIRSTNGGASWQKTRDFGGEIYYSIIENPQDQSLWATVVCDGLIQSTDGGNTWTVKNSNLTNTCLRDFGINPSTGAWYVSSDAGIFQSTNSGTSWSLTSAPVSGDIRFRSNGEIFIVGSGSVYKGSADATNWTNISPSIYARSIAVAQNGWLIAIGYPMKLSKDNGATWTDVYNDEVQISYVDPQGIIWAGGRSGLLRSIDHGMNWEPISLVGISDPYVTAITKRSADNKLYIGTNGSGIFKSVSTYQINAVTMTVPANLSTGVSRSPVLSCNPVTNASTYQFQISSASDFSSVVFDSLSGGTTVNVPVQLEAGSQYYTRARGVNDAGAGPWSQTIGFTTVFLTPAFSRTPVYLNQANEGQSFSVSVDSVRNKPSNVYLVYGVAGQETGTDLLMTLSGENFSASVPAQTVTQKGFWFRIKAVNTGGTAYSPSASGMYSVPVQLMTSGIAQVKSSGTYPAGIPTKAYYSVGNPLNANIDLTLVFGPADPKNWNAWYYDGTQFVETTVMDNTGRGYVIYNQTSATRDIIVTSATTNALNRFSDLVLKPGWNVVSWPLSYTANITIRNNALVGSVWSYNGKSGWQAVTQLKPFGAYAIYNRGSSDITAGSAITTGGIAKSATGESNGAVWQMNFTVKSGEYEDRFNRIGLATDEMESMLLNEPEPLSIGKGLSAYFHDSFRLASDFRKQTHNVHRWEMTIENHTESRQTELSWESVNLPDGQTVKIYDYSYDRVIDLREQTQYEFSIGKNHKLAVIAGSSGQVDQDIRKMRSNIPDDFFLSQNYPNPFNPSTTIQFGISKQSFVSLKIFNALGQEVTTLINDVKNPGQYQSVWNGKDRLGRSVASGIYIYRLQADGFTQTKKMLYLR